MTRYATPVIRRIALALLPAALVAGCSLTAAAAVAGHGLKQVRDPGRVTGTLHGHCTYQDKGQLPDPRCTPGSIDPIVTQGNIRSTICKSGWTATVRPPESQTERFKYDVAYPAYSTPQSEKTELDHLVPLELGGSNDATNLWPEPHPSSYVKDGGENALNAAVCEGRVSLAAARDAIAANWLTAEKNLGIGSTTSTGGRATCTATAAYAPSYGDYDIYVHSNQPDATVTATASNGASHSYHTDSTGYADVYLNAGAGDTVKVTAGSASCSTTA